MRQPAKLFAICFFLLLINPVLNQAQLPDSVRLKAIPRQLYWENKPLAFTNSGNSCTIVAGEKTDMFRDPNVTYNTDNAPKLLFRSDSNFVLTASVSHPFVSKWDGGAVVLKEDSLHWVKFCFEKDYTGARRVVSVVTNDISDDCNSAAISGNKVFYKVAKAGNVVTLYYSLDGQKWFLVRHFQVRTEGPLEVGFLAQSPTGKKCTVQFGQITYSSRKIQDPYSGE